MGGVPPPPVAPVGLMATPPAERPAFSKRPLNQAVLAEGTAEFPCEAVGDPQPAARWHKEEGEMPPGR